MKPDPTTSCIRILPNTSWPQAKRFIFHRSLMSPHWKYRLVKSAIRLTWGWFMTCWQSSSKNCLKQLSLFCSFQYRHSGYQAKLRQMKIKQSMSRKGNCHDNAPGETIFNLMKREKLNRIKISSLAEMQAVLRDYVYWFNHIRRSNKLKYTTPIKYRNRALGLA